MVHLPASQQLKQKFHNVRKKVGTSSPKKVPFKKRITLLWLLLFTLAKYTGNGAAKECIN